MTDHIKDFEQTIPRIEMVPAVIDNTGAAVNAVATVVFIFVVIALVLVFLSKGARK